MLFAHLVNTATLYKIGDCNARSLSHTPLFAKYINKQILHNGVEVLLTTAKDRINLDPDFAAIVQPLKLYWLEIRIEIDRREELISLIEVSILSGFSRLRSV